MKKIITCAVWDTGRFIPTISFHVREQGHGRARSGKDTTFMKNKPNKVTDAGRLPANAECPELHGHVLETFNKVEVRVMAHDICRCADHRSDDYENSALRCVPGQGQVCFRCLCRFGLSCPNQ